MKDGIANKKVLIITYYWPPSGGAGVQRWLKFTKYLPEFGWEPIVFTPENPDFDLQDESLLAQINPAVDVLKFPIWEPYGMFKKLSGTKKLKQGQILEEKKGPIKALSIFARGNLFIPDPKIFWVKPSVAYLKDIIVKNEIKHVITTGPPHSLHLIGLKLKYQIPSIQWMADFRDPWTEWDIMKQFRILPFLWNRHQKLEREVLNVADVTIATGEKAAKDFKRLGARMTAVLTNGYDVEIEPLDKVNQNKRNKVMLHLGMLNHNRVPSQFFKALNDVLSSNDSFSLQFTGIISPEVKEEIDGLNSLKSVSQFKESVPHKELIEEYAKADFLLLLQTNSEESSTQLPGKLFEYMAQKKPILAFGDPQSDVSKILSQTNSGLMLAYDDVDSIRKVTKQLMQGAFGESFTYEGIEQFSRKAITSKLADLLTS